MNQISLSGRLTSEIETREIHGRHLAKFTLAHNYGDQVLYMPVEAWNMEHLPRHLGKGSHVVIGGSLKQERWETNEGEKRSRCVLVARTVEFLSSTQRTGSTESGQASEPRPREREQGRRRDPRSRAA